MCFFFLYETTDMFICAETCKADIKQELSQLSQQLPDMNNFSTGESKMCNF